MSKKTDNILMNKIKEVLKAYHGDIKFWKETRDFEEINYFTSGTPYFNSDEEVGTYLYNVRSILKQLDNG